MSHRGLFYGWVVVAASATVIAVAMGALLSLGVFLKPIKDGMGWSRSRISIVALLNWLAMGLGSFVGGALSDRVGGRAVTVAGGFLLGLGLVLSSQVTVLAWFYVTFGVMVGFAVGAFYAPLSATASRWFTSPARRPHERRGRARREPRAGRPRLARRDPGRPPDQDRPRRDGRGRARRRGG